MTASLVNPFRASNVYWSMPMWINTRLLTSSASVDKSIEVCRSSRIELRKSFPQLLLKLESKNLTCKDLRRIGSAISALSASQLSSIADDVVYQCVGVFGAVNDYSPEKLRQIVEKYLSVRDVAGQIETERILHSRDWKLDPDTFSRWVKPSYTKSTRFSLASVLINCYYCATRTFAMATFFHSLAISMVGHWSRFDRDSSPLTFTGRPNLRCLVEIVGTIVLGQWESLDAFVSGKRW